jgi:hypothetical protein
LIEHPVKLMTPLVSLCEQPESVPGPPEVGVEGAIARVAVETFVVTALPYWSSTVTAGCVGKLAPPVELVGCVVKTSLDAVVGLTGKLPDVAGVTAPLVVSETVIV